MNPDQPDPFANVALDQPAWEGLSNAGPDLGGSVGALVGLLILVYFGAWVAAKLLRVAPPGGKEGWKLDLLASLRLDNDSALHVVQAGGRALLVGAGAKGLSLLAELDPPQIPLDEEEEQAAEDLSEPMEQEAPAPAPELAPEPRPETLAESREAALELAKAAHRRRRRALSKGTVQGLAGLTLALVLFGPRAALAQDGTDGPQGGIGRVEPISWISPPQNLSDAPAPGPWRSPQSAPAPSALETELADDAVRLEVRSGGEGGMASAIKVALLLTALTFLPALLTSATAFTRIVIVLSFARRAVGSNTLPPNQVIVGLALFLTIFVMAPVGTRIHSTAYAPYQAGQLDELQAVGEATEVLKEFMIMNVRKKDLALFVRLSGRPNPATARDLPFWVVAPAFLCSELTTAFLMAFAIYLPFLVVDMVVASALLSVGLIMVPPPLISAPLKLLLFVLADGWILLAKGLVTSFHVPALPV